MSAKSVQRFTIAAMIVLTIGGALAVHFVSQNQLNSDRSETVTLARTQVADALRQRAFYLQDVADMVGVHDDADATEFSRYAHVRASGDNAIVAVQWLRRAPPGGHLVPPAEIGPQPVLIAPTGPDRKLADASSAGAASKAIRLASASKRLGASAPVRLANGDPAFYLAVPVQAHRFSGDVSQAESRSAIVGLVDAQALLAGTSVGPLQLSDGGTPLGAVGGSLGDSVDVGIPAPGRHWTLTVAAGSLSTLDKALPWLILAIGGALTLAVGLMLSQAARRRDAAVVLAQQKHRELETAREGAERRSRLDPLTEIFNRRHFGEVLSDQMTKAAHGGDVAVLMMDLDHFKPINDEYGHLTGDVVLQVAAKLIASVLRKRDCLARWGGEEFVVLVPGMTEEQVTELGERARRAVADDPIDVDGTLITLTLSVGIAIGAPGLETPDAIVDAADQALYEAKRAGRDCVRVWRPEVNSSAARE